MSNRYIQLSSVVSVIKVIGKMLCSKQVHSPDIKSSPNTVGLMWTDSCPIYGTTENQTHSQDCLRGTYVIMLTSDFGQTLPPVGPVSVD